MAALRGIVISPEAEINSITALYDETRILEMATGDCDMQPRLN